MIGYLKGLVVERRSIGESATELVVDVRGVGYRVLVTPRLAEGLVPGDGEVALSVHTHVRESAITLYGFASTDERRSFELLLGAHGVGPGLALAVVAVHGPARLATIVAEDDADALTLVPGVGKKTAARMIIDLKTRFEQLLTELPLLSGAESRSHAAGPSSTAEVAEALASLGYGSDDVRSVLRELPADLTTEALLRLALRELAPRR
jgi:Holliday junction DNA helicase RuvA